MAPAADEWWWWIVSGASNGPPSEKPCRLCGEPIRIRQLVVQIRTGRQDAESWELTDSYVWHCFHLECYRSNPARIRFDGDGATIESECCSVCDGTGVIAVGLEAVGP